MCRSLSRIGEVTGLSRGVRAHPRRPHVVCDLTDAASTREAIQRSEPELVVHTQTLSDVDRCEREPEEAARQNVQTSVHVARALETSSALLIYLSTDYVFDGAKSAPYVETDTPHPLSSYGRVKLDAELAVLSYPRNAVVRTSTLFGPGRTTFCEQVMTQLRLGRPMEAFVDQVTSPTYTMDLAEAIGALGQALRESPQGRRPRLYHMANTGACRRAAFAERVAQELGYPAELIRWIRMAEQRRPAPRPAYSALGSVHVPQVIGRTLPTWERALTIYLRQARLAG